MTTNFAAFNARRTADAAARTAAAAAGAVARSDAQREVLALRIKYPDHSLAELGAMCTPAITKEQFAGRLRRALRPRVR